MQEAISREMFCTQIWRIVEFYEVDIEFGVEDEIETNHFENYVCTYLFHFSAAKKYPHKRAFFEMVRFDFVLDSKLNVYLMEVNMSPNLSTKHFSGNRLLYEQVIYNFLRLVVLV